MDRCRECGFWLPKFGCDLGACGNLEVRWQIVDHPENLPVTAHSFGCIHFEEKVTGSEWNHAIVSLDLRMGRGEEASESVAFVTEVWHGGTTDTVTMDQEYEPMSRLFARMCGKAEEQLGRQRGG